jgi:hypothetical protein
LENAIQIPARGADLLGQQPGFLDLGNDFRLADDDGVETAGDFEKMEERRLADQPVKVFPLSQAQAVFGGQKIKNGIRSAKLPAFSFRR